MGWSTCRYCGEKIVWAQMSAGHWLPMDPEFGGVHECVSFDRSGGTTIRAASTATTSTGHARSDLGEPLTHPTICPICGAEIFFHTNGNGDVVFFDELGWPWPKHGCLSTDERIRSASQSSGRVKKLLELRFRPTRISVDGNRTVRDFEVTLVGKEVTGVIITLKTKSGWFPKPGSVIRERKEVLSVTLHLAGNGGVVRIYLPGSAHVRVGDVLRATLDENLMDMRSVLFAVHYEIVNPDFKVDGYR